MRILILFVATGAGSGYSPIASGTVGSALGVLLFAALVWGFGLSTVGLVAVIGVLTIVGIWAAGRAEQIFGRKDDGRITVDEVVGMLVALVALPARLEVIVAAFFLFRLFDIWKPPPAGWLEALGGGTGCVADDMMAGVYANLAGQVLWRWILGTT